VAIFLVAIIGLAGGSVFIIWHFSERERLGFVLPSAAENDDTLPKNTAPNNAKSAGEQLWKLNIK
jgi:hypothetical protein